MSPFHRPAGGAPTIESACGPLAILSSSEQTPAGNVTLLTANVPGKMHVHRRATEFYYILSGTGVIRVGDERIHAEPESLVIIPPGTVHQVIPENAPFKVLVFCAPAWQEDDEILAE